MITLTLSKAPARHSMPSDNQRTFDTPKASVAIPKPVILFTSRIRHTRCLSDWSSDVCSSDLASRQAPRSGLYVIQDVCESAQDLDSQRLWSAWRSVAQRHPALGTSFVTDAGGDLWQRVNQDPEIPWQELDWTGVEPTQKADRLAAFLRRDWERGFEFYAGIPMRFALLRMPEHSIILIWTVHHALLDGRS